LFSQTSDPQAEEIVKKCIEKHGGWDKLEKVTDIYAKMRVRTFSDKGDIESDFYEYFRKPDKLRIKVVPDIEPPTEISWDGNLAYQLFKDETKASEDEKIKNRLQESLRFLKLMLLTTLFEPGSCLNYEGHIPKKNFGIHIISYTSVKKEKIDLYIHDNNYTLLGAEFVWTGTDMTFRIMFSKHEWFECGLFLPTLTELYKEEQLAMKAELISVKLNSLRNGNSFFSNLKENSRIKGSK
jgi:hypothetical protein